MWRHPTPPQTWPTCALLLTAGQAVDVGIECGQNLISLAKKDKAALRFTSPCSQNFATCLNLPALQIRGVLLKRFQDLQSSQVQTQIEISTDSAIPPTDIRAASPPRPALHASHTSLAAERLGGCSGAPLLADGAR